MFVFIYIIIINYTDLLKNLAIQVIRKEHPYMDIPDKEIDPMISFTKYSTIIVFMIGSFIDVTFRYLVIESLYQKYREQVKPAVVV